VTESKPK